MKHFITCILLTFYITTVIAETIIPAGEVSGEWTTEGSPFLIQGNISILDGETLIIESGVIVNFQGLYEFNIMGQLNSNNTSEDCINFTANQYWKGIRFNPSCNNNETSELMNFKIEKVKDSQLQTTIPLKIESSNIILSNFSITNCSGQISGFECGNIQAVKILDSSPIIKNCNIYNVTAQPSEDPGWATGIYVNGGSPLLINTVCSLINAEGILTGFSLHQSSAKIINSVIYQSVGQGLLSFGGNPTLINTIIWKHQSPFYFTAVYLSGSNPDFYYSNILGGVNGFALWQQTSYNGIYENNIDSDPNFVNPLEFDFHLSNDSSCIDAGTPSGWIIPPENDITIDELVGYNCIGNNYDIGAFEYLINAIEDDLLLLKRVNISNYPNPFNPTTTIEFSIQKNSKIELSIYNIKGQKIKSLLNDHIQAGEHSIVWNGKDSSGKKIGSGLYLYKLKVNDKAELVKKCLLLK